MMGRRVEDREKTKRQENRSYCGLKGTRREWLSKHKPRKFAVIHFIFFLICRQLRLDMGCDCDLSIAAVVA